MHNQSTVSQNSKYSIESDYINTSQTIEKCLNQRKRMIEALHIKINANSNLYLNANRKNQIIADCNKYVQLAPIFKQIKDFNSKQTDKRSKFEKFWAENQNLQSLLEEQLRDLKDIDIHIDNIVNEQFDKCNEIDEIQETIRVILSNKQPDHIKKAQPFYQNKNSCTEYLKIKAKQKNQVKQIKYELVLKILEKLTALKKHRENGLKLCENHSNLNNMSDKLSPEQISNKIKQAIQALYQINKVQKNSQLMKQEQMKLLHNTQMIQNQINQISKKLLNYTKKQNQICLQLQRLWKIRNESQFFKNVFLDAIGLANTSHNASKNAFHSLIQGLQKYQRQQKEKQSNLSKIQQGIQVTNNTVNIFQHILQKIKTESLRRKELLQSIEDIQATHNQQRQLREVVSEIESDIDKVKLKKTRLQKHLSEQVVQANLKGYKSIHAEIQSLQKQIKIKEQQKAVVRITIGDNAKMLYNKTLQLQQEYSDILSEVVPNYWFRDSDFTKQQAIKDLNMYLMKTFKRLQIAD